MLHDIVLKKNNNDRKKKEGFQPTDPGRAAQHVLRPNSETLCI